MDLINYAKGTSLAEHEYIERCAEAIDEFFNEWDESQLEQAADAGVALGSYLTHLCTECDDNTECMDEHDLHIIHRTYKGFVLVACEGYWMINPTLLGFTGHENWSDWTKLNDGDIEDLEGEG